MSAADLLKAGQLNAAIDAATQDVKSSPRNANARIFLFELLAAAGQWERAQKHLDVVADQATAMQEGIASYRAVLDAERVRARLFASGDGAPQQVTPSPVDAEPQLAVIRHLARGEVAEARKLLDESEAARAPRRGTIDGTPFDDFRDADDLLAPVLEVISQGRYGWIRFADVAKIELPAPKFFRDLLWAPADVTLTSGFRSRMFVPCRYPGSETSPDDAIRLGRTTDWLEDRGPVRGLGQRAFVAGEELHDMLETREVGFEA